MRREADKPVSGRHVKVAKGDTLSVAVAPLRRAGRDHHGRKRSQRRASACRPGARHSRSSNAEETCRGCARSRVRRPNLQGAEGLHTPHCHRRQARHQRTAARSPATSFDADEPPRRSGADRAASKNAASRGCQGQRCRAASRASRSRPRPSPRPAAIASAGQALSPKRKTPQANPARINAASQTLKLDKPAKPQAALARPRMHRRAGGKPRVASRRPGAERTEPMSRQQLPLAGERPRHLRVRHQGRWRPQ